MVAGSSTRQREEGLRRQLVALQQRSLADTSRRQYESTWRQWELFCQQLGRSPWLPESDSQTQSLQLVLFAISRWSSIPSGTKHARSISSIRAQLSHVKWYHRVFAGFEPTLTAGHATALEGIRRSSPNPRPKAPATRSMLDWIAKQIDYKKPQHRLILGAALLGFFYLLRSAEYLAIQGGRHRYALEVRDVEVFDATDRPAVNFRDATSAVITLRGSKTDQHGRGTSRRLMRSGHPRVCPVLGAAILLELAIQNHLQPTDPICSFSRSRTLKADELSKVLKAAAAANGFDAKQFSCHSLRSGGASALIGGGADSTTIKLHGRWKSDTFQRYTHYSDDVGAPLAAMMAGISNRTSRATSRPPSLNGVRVTY
eukprot:jgi/Phyca11/110429/e_gw1.18.207.1